MNSVGAFLESYPQTPISNMTSGQIYTLCSINLPIGKWFVFGRTLAGGDLIIDGNISTHINDRNDGVTSEGSVTAFAVSNGGIVNLKLRSNRFGNVHADPNYCALKAIRIG